MKPTVSAITALLVIMVTSLCFASPTVTTPTTTGVAANMATLVLQSSDTGTGYFTLLDGNGANCGDGTQVKAGQSASGAAHYFGSLLLAANTPGNYSLRNLAGSSAYTVCFTADSPSGSNLNADPVAVNLTTLEATAFTSPDWRAVGGAGFSVGSAHFTSLAFAPDGTPYVACVDANNSYKTTVMSYNGSSWGLVGNSEFAVGTANPASLAFAQDGTPYLAYVDASSSKAMVMQYNGSSWSVVGIPAFFADTDSTSLAFAPDGIPSVAYIDASDSKATVMNYSAGTWSVAGSSGLSSAGAWSTSLAIAPDGTPYVAYSDYDKVGRMTVMKYSAGTWTMVGSAGFSAGVAANTSLAIAPDGTPYVAYRDGGNGNKATVMMYSGDAWNVVGSAGFSAGTATNISLAVAPDGTLYVAYQDGGNGSKATTMKYSGGAWNVAGSAGFSAGTVTSTSLAFDPGGVPHVAYGDVGNGSRATVMKLINLSPTVSGTPAATATVGVAYSFTPTATYADSFTVTNNLPPGLSLNTTTGVLSGIPTVAGAGITYSNIIITAFNSIGSDELPAFSITVIDIPETAITSTPVNPDSSASFSFAFTSSVPGSSFECSLSGAAYAVSSSPYSGSIAPCTVCRTDTAMNFAVRAISPAGKTDPTPASYAWTVNQTIGTLFDNVLAGGAVQLKATDYTGALNFNRGVAFTLKGGYDTGYSANSGLTNIHGTFTISAGTVTIENIVIM